MGGFLKFLFTFVIIAGLGLAVLGWFYVSRELPKEGPLAAEKIVYIPMGSGVRQIGATLLENGVIADEWMFRLGAIVLKTGGSMKAGEYKLAPKISIADTIKLLQSGKTYQRQLTIPEGLTSFEIVELVNAAEAMEGTLDISRLPAEGSLLPETYNYTHGDKRAAIIDRMAASMKKTLAEYWTKRDPKSPIKNENEWVTMASVVERETALTTERPRVAGVFLNRLKIGMPLQSDPTTIYAVTEGKGKLGRPLTTADLRIDSPYNTYVAAGLPPGPIANPGRASLIAVLQPEEHQYLYFVADGTGGHAFGRSLDEHNANVAKWRALQRQK
ncbi:MAG: aminodeoxychorismate lyase [Alphaproteobacteria bacterium]|jgi:UPF0755 protein|nr:aminodeoxychorismate lyase [Alphaproteobacteria bacterium]